MLRGKIGIALGSGGSRGFAHVGVLRGLLHAGIVPEIVCGSSAGAVVGAAYAANRLDAFEVWARQLDRRQVMGLLDLSFRGGALRGRRMIERVGALLPEIDADALPLRYAAVATDLESGREEWLREGPLLDLLHASCAVPGVVSPVRRDGRWMIDGGIVNPVPVSLCRALGADTVIAVDLNAALLARRFRGEVQPEIAAPSVDAGEPASHTSVPAATPSAEANSPGPAARASELSAVNHEADASEASASRSLQHIWGELRQRFAGSNPDERPEAASPGLYDVLDNALQIMQVRITRSRMAGDPPELLVTPRLPDFALLDLHRANEAIDEGRRAVAVALATFERT